MKTFILCGGLGIRLDYEGTLIAKPMVRIGPKPILMHIVDNYIEQNFYEFVFCLGHKSNTIINYFLNERKKNIRILFKDKTHIKFEYKDKKNRFYGHLIYTGLNTGTGGRIKIAYNKLKLNSDDIKEIEQTGKIELANLIQSICYLLKSLSNKGMLYGNLRTENILLKLN